ncbi:hypothetical protein BDR07DRAFT_1484058 [Suillus spraguei]|nr:hypothetical protein BDR07DRAFT_1484058 [Suillus spraguei]
MGFLSKESPHPIALGLGDVWKYTYIASNSQDSRLEEAVRSVGSMSQAMIPVPELP